MAVFLKDVRLSKMIIETVNVMVKTTVRLLNSNIGLSFTTV